VTRENDGVSHWDVAVRPSLSPGWPNSERTELVEGEHPVRETLQHLLDAVQLGVAIGDLTDPQAPVQTSLLSTDDDTTDHEITNVALSPDGGILAVSEYDGTVRLYNITDPTKPLQALIDAVATGRPLDLYRPDPPSTNHR